MLCHFPAFKVSSLTKCKEHEIRGLGFKLYSALLPSCIISDARYLWNTNELMYKKGVSYKELDTS